MSDSEVQQIESADAVIGLVPAPSRDGASVEHTIARILETPVPVKVALVHPPLPAERSSALKVNSHWSLIANPQLVQDPSAFAQSLGDSFRATFDIVWLSGWAPHESQQKPLKPGSATMRLEAALKTLPNADQ